MRECFKKLLDWETIAAKLRIGERSTTIAKASKIASYWRFEKAKKNI